MKLIEIKEIKTVIVLESGLHIGSGNDDIKIGGIDNPVIKNPITGHPYIPGSSLKGKIRTLLEWSEGNIGAKGKPFTAKDSENLIARIFGNGSIEDDYAGGPTRVSFSDCELLDESAKALISANSLTEAKAEVAIDRFSGTAARSGPRFTERVPAGAKFGCVISFKIFDMDDDGKVDREAFELLKTGIKMLTLDSLGGSGSRGYGKVRFEEMVENTAWPRGE